MNEGGEKEEEEGSERDGGNILGVGFVLPVLISGNKSANALDILPAWYASTLAAP
jgi:hypothetical protein